MGLSGSSSTPRAALSAVFHELPPFTQLKEKQSLARLRVERHSCILCKVMCLTSQIFPLVVGEAGSVQAVEGAHLVCVLHYLREGKAAPFHR